MLLESYGVVTHSDTNALTEHTKTLMAYSTNFSSLYHK